MALGQMFLFPIEAPPSQVAVARANADTAISKRRPSTLASGVVPPAPLANVLHAPASLPAVQPAADPPQAGQRQALLPTKPSLDQLRAQVQRIQSRRRSGEADTEPRFSTGDTVLDAMLPHGGLRPGTIVQWIGDVHGSGASSLSLIAAAQIAHSEFSGGKPLVIIDSDNQFYPPAAISLGIPADRMVIVHKNRHHQHADMIWAIDQALRCNAVAAVWVEIGPWLNDRDARRLQLAAEAGGTVGLFVRPTAVRGRPSFADINWHVSPYQEKVPGSGLSGPLLSASESSSANASNRRLRVQIDRCRGGAEGAVAMIEITSQQSEITSQQRKGRHESTLASDLAHQLAHPTTAKRPAADRSSHGTRRAS